MGVSRRRNTVIIEFYSDFICPWCYIGKTRVHRLARKLENEINLSIDLKPFILYPDIPEGGADKSLFVKRTKPGMGRSLREEAKIEGIQLAYDQISRIPNSLPAHVLISNIDDLGLKFDIGLNIMNAYFQKGANIEDHDILKDLVREHMKGKDWIGHIQNGTNDYTEILKEVKMARHNQISVVPTIRMNQQVMIPGLQSFEVWEKYLRRAADRLTSP